MRWKRLGVAADVYSTGKVLSVTAVPVVFRV